MKSILTAVLILFSLSAVARPTLADLDPELVKADKAQVLKAETARLTRILGKSSSSAKSLLTRCPEPEVDVDVDVYVRPEPTVSPYCESRWSDGSCSRYGADARGTCTPYCESRWSDGSCSRWGKDVCN